MKNFKHTVLTQVKASVQVLGLASVALSFTACSSLTHKKDDVSLAQVKRVAVVAFSAYEPASASIGLNLGSGKTEAGMGGTMIPQSDANVDRMYADLGSALAKNEHWNVMSEKALQQKPGYIEAYNKTMKGFHNKMPPGAGMKQFNVKDVMDFDCPRILDTAGRDALIDALGVDAIVVARVDVHLNGTTVMGIGSRHPQSNLSFNVYKKGSAEPIWFEGKIAGNESEQSVGKTAFIDEALLNKLALESAQSAYEKIGASAKE